MSHHTNVQVDQSQHRVPPGGCALHIINGISFAIDAGPSGSVKSMLVSILAERSAPASTAWKIRSVWNEKSSFSILVSEVRT